MSTGSKATALITREQSGPEGAEQRLNELGIKLPEPPEPFGTYVEAVQTGKLLFLTGMLPTEGREAKFIGRVGFLSFPKTSCSNSEAASATFG